MLLPRTGTEGLLGSSPRKQDRRHSVISNHYENNPTDIKLVSVGLFSYQDVLRRYAYWRSTIPILTC